MIKNLKLCKIKHFKIPTLSFLNNEFIILKMTQYDIRHIIHINK